MSDENHLHKKNYFILNPIAKIAVTLKLNYDRIRFKLSSILYKTEDSSLIREIEYKWYKVECIRLLECSKLYKLYK